MRVSGLTKKSSQSRQYSAFIEVFAGGKGVTKVTDSEVINVFRGLIDIYIIYRTFNLGRKSLGNYPVFRTFPLVALG